MYPMSQGKSSLCEACQGTGQVALFTSLILCRTCDGLGWVLPDSYKNFFNDLCEYQPDLMRAIAEYYLGKLENTE